VDAVAPTFGSRPARSMLLLVFQRTSKDVASRRRSKCGRADIWWITSAQPIRPNAGRLVLNLGMRAESLVVLQCYIAAECAGVDQAVGRCQRFGYYHPHRRENLNSHKPNLTYWSFVIRNGMIYTSLTGINWDTSSLRNSSYNSSLTDWIPSNGIFCNQGQNF
jgi:hypothetical protein